MQLDPPIVANLIFIACAILFAIFPFDKSRARAVWATWIFLAFSALALVIGVINIALKLHWIVLEQDWEEPLHVILVGMMGVAIGLVFTLVVSGQLMGTKRPFQLGPPS
jgi:membrane protease YdiL (CAAX protease family)